MKNVFIFIALFLLQQNANAADSIVSLVKVGLISENGYTTLGGPAGPDTKYQTAPGAHLGIGLNFGPIILFISGSDNASDKDKYGETDQSDFQFKFYMVNHSFEISDHIAKGFYIENSTEVNPSWTSNNKMQRTDLEERDFRIDYYYMFSPEDFHVGILDQNVVPKASGGTFLVGANFERFNINGTNSIAPTNLISSYGNLGLTSEATISSLRIGGGGAYVLDFSGVYLAGLLYYSIGPNSQKITYLSGDDSKSDFGGEALVRLAFGYNGDNFFTALDVDGRGKKYSLPTGTITQSDGNASLWFGWRF